jgi:hypothetical protein
VGRGDERVPRSHAGRRAPGATTPGNYALLLPSLWVVLTWILPVTSSTTAHFVLFWFGVVITLLGMPVLAVLMMRLLIPPTEQLARRQALAAIAAVLAVMAVAYVLGTQHPHMLSCQDFSVSGNFAPENCNPGAETGQG